MYFASLFTSTRRIWPNFIHSFKANQCYYWTYWSSSRQSMVHNFIFKYRLYIYIYIQTIETDYNNCSSFFLLISFSVFLLDLIFFCSNLYVLVKVSEHTGQWPIFSSFAYFDYKKSINQLLIKQTAQFWKLYKIELNFF